MKIKYILQTALFIMAMTSCDDKDLSLDDAHVQGNDNYYFYLAEEPHTRVSYDNDNHSVFESGDRLGAFALNDDGFTAVDGQPVNVPYEVRIYDGKKRLVSVGVTPLAKGQPKYLFYYPYKADMTIDMLKNLTHTIELNQADDDGYEKSDLLWDIAVETSDWSGPKVAVAMDHAMANIIVNFTADMMTPVDEIYFTSCAPTATGVNLLSSTLDELNDDRNYKTAGDVSSKIKMYNYKGDTDAQKRVFRAAVPAHQTIQAGSTIIMTGKNGGDRKFRIKNELTLEPGKNYYFTVGNKPNYPIPNDDDSWVLDVRDKEGNLVGLLCREYLVFQPNGTADKDEKTGVPFGNTKSLNTHAWVLYQLDEKKVPILSEGKILCFLYDFEYRAWCDLPNPNISSKAAGMFDMPHGCTTVKKGGTGADGNDDKTSDTATEYGMVGGTVVWMASNSNSEIVDFEMPKGEIIPNNLALVNGHVTATGDGGCDLSYIPEEEDPEACFVIPRVITDSRDGKTYPLTKIGYNQFWISKSFDYDGEIDGKPLVCYNSRSGGINIPKEESKINPGYMYLFYTLDKEEYDPYKLNYENTPRFGSNYVPIKMYNLLTMGDKILPPLQSSDNLQGGSYHLPKSSDTEVLVKYVGGYPVMKLTARYRIPVINMKYGYSRVQGSWRGEIPQAGESNAAYAGNVSGFNCRGLGWFGFDISNTDCNMPGIDGVVCLNEPDRIPRVTVMNLHNWHMWATREACLDDGNIEQCVYRTTAAGATEINNGRVPVVYTKSFAQVRFFLSFRQTNLKPRSNISSRAVAHRQSPSRNVYVETME